MGLKRRCNIYGHRGARGLAPENTLPAYKTALDLGVDVVDMDVGMTQDGVIVVTHDPHLNPDITRDVSGQWLKNNDILIKNLNLAQLQQFDVGRIKPGSPYSKLFSSQIAMDYTPIPTLKEVITAVKKYGGEHVRFQIEIKTNPEYPTWTFTPKEFAEAVAKILCEENIVHRTEIQAFDYRCLLELQNINPEIATAYLTYGYGVKQMLSPDKQLAGLWTGGHLLQDHNKSVPAFIAALGGKIWGPQDIEVNPQLVSEAHYYGLKVVPWSWPEKTGTEIDLPLTQRLMAMGVDGIITDRPDLVLK